MNFIDIISQVFTADSLQSGVDYCMAGLGLLPGVGKSKDKDNTVLVQERPGFHLGISQGVQAAGRQAARITYERYQEWLESGLRRSGGGARKDYFAIAVGGGNTVRNQYKALLQHHFFDFNWIDHVRFFYIEETCNVKNWAGTHATLVSTLIEPLAERLISTQGVSTLRLRLGLPQKASRRQIVERIVDLMTYPIDMSGVERAVKREGREQALEEARLEAHRYQALLKEFLGPDLVCHVILSGIGKDGGIGAFAPYAPELKERKPGVIVVDKANEGISVALNRGALIGAECISLIIAGSLKLRALGRFEMDDSAPFEQTVQETPIRMLRETREIAEKVYIFADNEALYFEEGVFRFQEDGQQLEVKSELREGDEEGGIHMLLVHGFMGLYSYINLLIGLPSAWRVSALRRGSHAKTLPGEEVFPHYARTLRKMIMREWRSQRPTPFCCHSMGGIISDLLLLSVLPDPEGELPEFDELNSEDRRLIEAIRTSGMIEIATWAPSDTCHLMKNFEQIRAYRKDNSIKLDLSGASEIYDLTPEGTLVLNSEHANLRSAPAAADTLLKLPGVESIVKGLNAAVRYAARSGKLAKLAGQDQGAYGKRLLGERVLQKVSFYGVLKEMLASMHEPHEHQKRHVKALDVVIKYDIPYLVIVHEDDYMVSANRHIQEHKYLLKARKAKEGVTRESELEVPTRLVVLKSDSDEPPEDLVDPHFLILSNSEEGAGNARIVTAEITEFVNGNVARAIDAGRVPPLASIEKWRRGKSN